MSIKWVKFRVHGKVQHVFFRRDTKILADKLGLFGYVKNESDGTVTGQVGGDGNTVDQFIEVIKVGVNERANVTNCEVDELPYDPNMYKHITSFDIVR